MVIDSTTSKHILGSIVSNKVINYKKWNLIEHKTRIIKLKKDYNLYKKNNKFVNEYKFYIFWELIKKKYSIKRLSLRKRNQKLKSNKINIEFSEFGKILGYNPSLLSMLIFDDKLNILLKTSKFFNEFEKICELEKIKTSVKLDIINSIESGEIHIITPLCPDYEHVHLGMGLYKYTFNKLNDGLGLIGKRLSIIIHKFHLLLKKYKIKYKHHLYYGDFESYSLDICNRLKISENQFIKQLEKSSKKMDERLNKVAEVKLLVKEISNKKDWIKRCKINVNKLKKKYDLDINYKRTINEIVSSRTELYSSWFPEKNEKDFLDLVIKQGAEYSTMGDLFKLRFNNLIVLGLDHPKMASFYSLNKNVPVIYGKPKYV